MSDLDEAVEAVVRLWGGYDAEPDTETAWANAEEIVELIAPLIVKAERDRIRRGVAEIDWDRSLPELTYTRDAEEGMRKARQAALAVIDEKGDGPY